MKNDDCRIIEVCQCGVTCGKAKFEPSLVRTKEAQPGWLTWATLNLHRNLSAKLLLSACNHLPFHHEPPHIPLPPSPALRAAVSLLFVQRSSHSDLVIVAQRRACLLCCPKGPLNTVTPPPPNNCPPDDKTE